MLKFRIEWFALKGEAVSVCTKRGLESEFLLLAEKSWLDDTCESLLLVGETQKQFWWILWHLFALFSGFVDGRLANVANLLSFLL